MSPRCPQMWTALLVFSAISLQSFSLQSFWLKRSDKLKMMGNKKWAPLARDETPGFYASDSMHAFTSGMRHHASAMHHHSDEP